MAKVLSETQLEQFRRDGVVFPLRALSGSEAGALVLDEYIAEHFELLAQHGEYLVMWRKGIPKPKHN